MTSNSKQRRKVVSLTPPDTDKKLPIWPKNTLIRPPRTRLLKMQRTKLKDRELLKTRKGMMT